MPNGPTNPWSQSNSSSLRQNQGDSYLNIPEATLRWFRHRGDRGPRSYALTARHVVYDLTDLHAWAEEQKSKTQRVGQ